MPATAEHEAESEAVTVPLVLVIPAVVIPVAVFDAAGRRHYETGILSAALFVFSVEPGSPADKKPPSEYAKRNCYLAAVLMPFESSMIDYMGADHIMWGSDYPHEEGFAPHSKLALRWALHDRPEDATANLLGPIVVNVRNGEACQTVLPHTIYSVKAPLARAA